MAVLTDLSTSSTERALLDRARRRPLQPTSWLRLSLR